MPYIQKIDRTVWKNCRHKHKDGRFGSHGQQVRFHRKEPGIDILGFSPELLGKFPDILRCTDPVEYEIHNIQKKGFEQQGQCPSHEKRIDCLPGDVADIITADIAAHRCINEQYKVGDAAENDVAEHIELFEDKREQIKMKYRKEQHQGEPFVKSTLQTYLEKIKRPLEC